MIAGHAWGLRSPVRTYSDTLYVAAEMQAGGRIALPAEHEQRAVYVAEGEVRIAGEPLAPFHMAVLPEGRTVIIEAVTAARVMLLGGARMDGDRHIWWNFVASSHERIAEAKTRWREQRFAAVPGETEFIPLPDR